MRANQLLFNPFYITKNNKEKIVLHKDMIDGMTLDQIIDLAQAEFENSLPDSANLHVKIASDDGGRLIEFFVEGKKNAEQLRQELPPNYKKLRTVVMYRYETDPSLEDILY
tara:strand:+ start:1034 stop:1366 length:333 start_codon:yes stop_codon:yes gene_type:complete